MCKYETCLHIHMYTIYIRIVMMLWAKWVESNKNVNSISRQPLVFSIQKKTYYYDRWKNVKNKPQNIERKNLLINQSIIDTYWCWMYFYFLYKYKYFFSRIHIQVISVSSNPIQSMHMLFIYTIKNGKSSITFDFVGRHTCTYVV